MHSLDGQAHVVVRLAGVLSPARHLAAIVKLDIRFVFPGGEFLVALVRPGPGTKGRQRGMPLSRLGAGRKDPLPHAIPGERPGQVFEAQNCGREP